MEDQEVEVVELHRQSTTSSRSEGWCGNSSTTSSIKDLLTGGEFHQAFLEANGAGGGGWSNSCSSNMLVLILQE